MAGGSDSGIESTVSDSQSSNADSQSSDSVSVGPAVAWQPYDLNPPQARGRLHRYTEFGRELGRKLEVWKPYICSGCQRYLPANDLKARGSGDDWYRYDREERELVRVRRWMSTRHCGMCKLLTQLVEDHDEIDSKRKSCLLVPRQSSWPRKPFLKDWPLRYYVTVKNRADRPEPRSWFKFHSDHIYSPMGIELFGPEWVPGPFRDVRNNWKDRGIIMVAEEKRDPNGYGVKLLDRNKVDFDHVKSWIGACDYHYEECRSPRSLSRVLRVVDCQTKKVVTKPDDSEYLTLSYVWGNRKPPIGDPHRLENPFDLENPPRVVRDAMAVTLELGYQYLWVDKYCIDQADVAGKMAEIAVMDQIYENAILTIVDAAGDHDDYGLVGCGTTPIRCREEQPVARVGSRTYTWTLLGVACAVNSSPWVTRGWTFQEGLLSTRCLFFTKEQVYFVCKAGSECETVPRRPDAEYFDDNIKLSGLFKTDRSMVIDRRYDSIPGQGYLADLIDLIDMYAARSLTDDSDALNAFRGVLARCHFHTYWGTPFIQLTELFGSGGPYRLPEDSSDPGNVAAAFLAGLAWRPTTRVTKHVSKHRTCMPSWSWLGISKVSINYKLDRVNEKNREDETLSTRNATCEISAMTHLDGLETAEPIFKIWKEANNWVIPELSKYIKITAPAANVVGIKWRRPVSGILEAFLPIELSIQGSENKSWTLDCDTRRTWLRLKKASQKWTKIPLDLKVIWLKHRFSQPPYSRVIELYLVLQRYTECYKRIGRIHWRGSAPAELLSTRVETIVLG